MIEQSEMVNARKAAQRLGVSYSTIRLWIKTRQIQATKEAGEWLIPASEIDRLLAELDSYNRKHASKILAAELLVERAGTQHGLTVRAAVNASRELVKLAHEWTKRARKGASHEATSELSQGVRGRIALIAAYEARLQMLDQVIAIAMDLLPRDPRRALIELSIRVGGLEPAEAQRIVAGLSDDEVRDRLENAPAVLAGAPEPA